MKRPLQHIKTCLLTGMLVAGMTGCNSWLDLNPENKQTSATYWNKKEDVEAVVMSGYTRLRGCLQQIIEWGELRGDGLALDAKASTDEQKIVELDILSDNGICKWDKFYKVIGSANSILKYGPEVLQKDPTFAEALLNSYIAECVFLRSLSYFYLLRTFGEVPLVLEPYVDDEISFKQGKSSERVIIDQLVTDLKSVIKTAKPGFETEWENKGRASRWAVYALLADIYLWDEQYQNCIDACDELFKTEMVGFIEDPEEWFDIFLEGNTDEGIFELQYNTTQTNDLYKWFETEPRFKLSEASNLLFQEVPGVNDNRGAGASYVTSDYHIWKYIGAGIGEAAGKTERKGNNWIFYRYSEIMLMKAEALAMLGGPENYQASVDLVNIIRRRAGYTTDLRAANNEYDALMMVIDERQREFIAEGKRWFDILRVAKRNNYAHKNYLIDKLLASVSAANRPIYESKLQDPNSYYLPIHENEIKNNTGILVQNPYYLTNN